LLRPIERDDAEAIFLGYSGSPTATRFMNFQRHKSSHEAAVRAAMRSVLEGSVGLPWAVIWKRASEFMGVVELRVNPPQADFGYIFGDRLWGQGFATEATTPIVDRYAAARWFEATRFI
jgi:RimJ/RimL family protein N-acetyltransferase